MPARVRITATRSPGCICSSTNFFKDRRTKCVLSQERPRSSTTSAIVRRTCSGRSRIGGSGTTAGARASLRGGAVGVSRAAACSTYEKLVILWGRPSSRISKSLAVRLPTCLPLESVTTASIWTRFTVTRKTGSCDAGGCCASSRQAMAAVRSILRPAIMTGLLSGLGGAAVHETRPAASPLRGLGQRQAPATVL